MSKLSPKEKRLLSLLRELPYDEDEIPNEHENGIIINMLAAREYGLTDEFIELINSEKGRSFEEIERIISDSGLLPEIEIVDDDESETDKSTRQTQH